MKVSRHLETQLCSSKIAMINSNFHFKKETKVLLKNSKIQRRVQPFMKAIFIITNLAADRKAYLHR